MYSGVRKAGYVSGIVPSVGRLVGRLGETVRLAEGERALLEPEISGNVEVYPAQSSGKRRRVTRAYIHYTFTTISQRNKNISKRNKLRYYSYCTMKDIPDHVLSTVVRLIVHKTHADADTPYAVSTGSTATGTGFFIDTHGHILTCAHVIADASQVEVEIPSKGNRRFKATLLGICPVFDLGMVRIVNYSYSNACSLDEHAWDTVQSGDAVTAVGFPLKMSHQKQTHGVVVGREMNKYQTDVVILSGNSGGPLFKDSLVIGVNSNSPAREDVEDAVIGYAVPIARYYLV